jgi:hypothetical protein
MDNNFQSTNLFTKYLKYHYQLFIINQNIENVMKN